MTAKPMYVWDGAAWTPIGPTVPQTPIAYQASAPASPSTGDIWVDSDGDVGTFDRQLVRYRFVASGGETSLSGIDANGFTLAYVPGAEQVYLNGVLLVRTSDYTATNGTSITALSPALAANDVVEVFAYNSFNLANTYTQAQIDGGFATKAENGLVHILTTDFSGAVSHSFGSDASPIFTSTYSNYKIIIDNCVSATANQDLFIRVRANTTDLTSSVYYYQSIAGDGTSVPGFRVNGGTNVRIGLVPLTGGTGTGSSVIEIQNPQTTKVTTIISQNIAGINASIQSRIIYGYVGNTNQYNGFTIAGESGYNISGTISIFGYKK